MMKLVAGCVWISLATAAAAYGAALWRLDHLGGMSSERSIDKLEYQKTRSINVPMIADGAVAGYVVVQFGYTALNNGKEMSVPPEVFLLDEAFRTIYADPKLDFRHLEKYDVAALTKTLVEKVNRRLNANIIQDVLVEELNFVPKEDISK